MPDGFSWTQSRDSAVYQLPGPDRLGWWAAVAMLISILFHVVVFFALDRMKLAIKFEEAKELSTRAINLRQVEVRPSDNERSLPPEDVVKPSSDTNSLLEEIDVLAKLPENAEIDMRPNVTQAEYALKMQNPALKGDPEASALEIASGFELDTELPEFGREPTTLRPAEIGQITVDPGDVQIVDSDLGKFTEDILRRGANGKTENGTLDGVTTLDNLLDLPPNLLLNSKTMLPSDLLFEFNSSDLRESAKVGLMKLALLMDQNPLLYCWIEGHTDLVGGDDFNLALSVNRAESVKRYLVTSLKLDESKIVTRGFGRYQPVVITGTSAEQSPNRRVEVRMRKAPPTEQQMKVTPEKAAIVVDPQTPKAVLVKPKRALPIAEEPAPPKAASVVDESLMEEPPQAEEVPRATAVEIPTATPLPRATPVEPEIPRARPVE